MEVREHLLAHRPLAVERFHVPAGLIEPDSVEGRSIKAIAVFAGHLQRRGRAIGHRLGPAGGHVAAGADLGRDLAFPDRVGPEKSRLIIS